MFSKYLSTLPRAQLTEAVASLYGVLLEASEGEAGKYFRKAIRSADPEIVQKLHDDVVAVMRDDRPSEPEEHWVEWLWNWFRQDFSLRNSDAVYFAPGLARIVLCQPDSEQVFEYYPLDALSRNATLMKDIVHYITLAHKDDYTRYLVDKKTGQPATFDGLSEKFGAALKKHGEEVMSSLEDMEYTPSNYVIVELTDFETANEYAEATELNDESRWCYLDDEETFDYYRQGGTIRCYLAYKPGFESLYPGDKGYGQSMLGIDIGPGNQLIHCNNRYNHDDDPELDNKANPPGDNRFNATELSKLLGGPYYKFCPYYNAEERKRLQIYTAEDVMEALANGEPISSMVTVKNKMDNGDAIISVRDMEFNILTHDNKLLLSKWLDSIVPITFKNEPCYLAFYHDKGNILDSAGHPIFDKWYDSLRTYISSDFIQVQDGSLLNQIDVSTGNFVFKNWYRVLPTEISENVYAARLSDGKIHFIDNDENDITDLTVDSIKKLDDEYSWIELDNKFNILQHDIVKPRLNPWFDDRERVRIPNVNIEKVMVNTPDRDKVFNLIDLDYPDHYVLDTWCHNIVILEQNLLRLEYYNKDTKESTYNLYNTSTHKMVFKEPVEWLTIGNNRIHVHKNGSRLHQLTDMKGNPLFNDWVENYEDDKKHRGYWLTKDGKRNYSRTDKSLALEQWYDDAWHGIVDGDYVVTVKNDDGAKLNILRNGKPLLDKWADGISMEYDDKGYYVLKYGDLYTIADQNGKIMLDDMYGGIYDIYGDGRIVVRTTEPNVHKYTICKHGKPILDGWYTIGSMSWGNDENVLNLYTNFTIVKHNNKYNVLLTSDKWLMDQWYDYVSASDPDRLCFLIALNGKYNFWNYNHVEFDQWFDKVDTATYGDPYVFIGDKKFKAQVNRNELGGKMTLR